MKRILVTGVTGQIGYYVAEQLSKDGHQVFGLERQTTQGRPGGAPLPYEPVSGDLLDEYSLLSLIERCGPRSSTTSRRRASSPRRGTSRS